MASASISMSSIFGISDTVDNKGKKGGTDLYQGVRPGFGKGTKTQFGERHKGFLFSALKNQETWRSRQDERPKTEKDPR
jgi:hypothetical protein